LLEENSQYVYILVLVSPQNIIGLDAGRRWKNLDRFQYRFQPIKFVNSVVLSPCETQPYNNVQYNTVMYNYYLDLSVERKDQWKNYCTNGRNKQTKQKQTNKQTNKQTKGEQMIEQTEIL